MNLKLITLTIILYEMTASAALPYDVCVIDYVGDGKSLEFRDCMQEESLRMQDPCDADFRQCVYDELFFLDTCVEQIRQCKAAEPANDK